MHEDHRRKGAGAVGDAGVELQAFAAGLGVFDRDGSCGAGRGGEREEDEGEAGGVLHGSERPGAGARKAPA